MDEREYRIAFTLSQGIGPVTYRNILDDLHRQGQSVEELFKSDVSVLEQMGLKDRIVDGLTQMREKLDDVCDMLEVLSDRDMVPIVEGDPAYPERLLKFQGRNASPVLYAFGNTDLLTNATGAVVGTRNPSEPGQSLARRAAKALVQADRTVVSGCARGVDSIAHTEALEAGGSTIGVLSQGILASTVVDAFIGSASRSDYLLLSEFPPNQTWKAGAAMIRNRTICALSDLVIAVQASEKGGTMNSGCAALDMGVPLFTMALEESERAQWKGNEILIEKGAVPIETDPETDESDFSPMNDPKNLKPHTKPQQSTLF